MKRKTNNHKNRAAKDMISNICSVCNNTGRLTRQRTGSHAQSVSGAFMSLVEKKPKGAGGSLMMTHLTFKDSVFGLMDQGSFLPQSHDVQ